AIQSEAWNDRGVVLNSALSLRRKRHAVDQHQRSGVGAVQGVDVDPLDEILEICSGERRRHVVLKLGQRRQEVANRNGAGLREILLTERCHWNTDRNSAADQGSRDQYLFGWQFGSAGLRHLRLGNLLSLRLCSLGLSDLDLRELLFLIDGLRLGAGCSS